MQVELGSKKLYVKNDDGLIYQTEYISIHDGCDWLEVRLKLVCGYDYISPDTSDAQGYVNPDRFTESVQEDSALQYFLVESMKECLEGNGYTVIESLPIIH